LKFKIWCENKFTLRVSSYALRELISASLPSNRDECELSQLNSRSYHFFSILIKRRRN